MIKSHAGIFFDSNPVVMTDTASLLIGCPLSIKNLSRSMEYSVYPNPAQNLLHVLVSPAQCSHFALLNIMGQKLLNKAVTQQTTQVDISTLPAGVYYVELFGVNGNEVVKVVKW
jgi:hypothetical protein